MLNDPILDWLKFKNGSVAGSGSGCGSGSGSGKSDFLNFILSQGRKFEDSVMIYIKQFLDVKGISFAQISHGVSDIYSMEKYKETINAINNQVGVIYQGVLHGNDKFKSFGCPDLLIRSDVVNLLFDKQIEDVGGKFNYVVIDIKFSNLCLKSDGKFLLNNGRFPANKAQVMIYNELLGIVQGCAPAYCYILGRGWKYTQRGVTYQCSRFNERLGVIDVYGKDSFYKDKIYKAFEWLNSIKVCGYKWEVNPPSVSNLYPNMCNEYNNNFGPQKKKIASEIDEITQLWYCGVKQRNLAHSKGIFKLSDPRLTTEAMGLLQGSERTKLIDSMLKFRQGVIGNGEAVIPKYVNDWYDWHKKMEVEFYLDFEVFTNVFDDFSSIPTSKNESIVFMTGIGVLTEDKWDYYNFRINELTDSAEYDMFNMVYNKIKEICECYKIDVGNAKIFHWGNIEQSIIDGLYIKYEHKHNWEDLLLIDFCKVFQEESILVRGVYDFSIKSIGKGLISHGLIKLPSWDNNMCDGLSAMIQAYDIYKHPEKDHREILNNLVNYNHTDVMMIEKIINYLRKNHTVT
jgi:hypothetical protein